mmetsp:Transcript_10938/g.26073  ORF Transcript_10938/g.26073 Transcript_10938/m.26073 type:complete len:83 (-) Transcript_10938:1254-1502(-)
MRSGRLFTDKCVFVIVCLGISRDVEIHISARMTPNEYSPTETLSKNCDIVVFVFRLFWCVYFPVHQPKTKQATQQRTCSPSQ